MLLQMASFHSFINQHFLSLDNPSGIPGQRPLHSLSHTRQAWPHPASLCKALQHPRWELELQMFYQVTCHLVARDGLGWLTGERPNRDILTEPGPRAATAEAGVWGLGSSNPSLRNTHRDTRHILCIWQGSCALRRQQRASSSWAPA